MKYYKNCTGADGKFNGIQYSLDSEIKTRDPRTAPDQSFQPTTERSVDP